MRILSNMIFTLTYFACLASSQCDSFSTNQCIFLFANASCSFLVCTNRPSDSQSSHQSVPLSHLWEECTASCCAKYNGPSNPKTKTIDTLALYCSVNPSASLPIGVTVAVAVGLLVFILLAVVFCRYYKLVECNCPCLRGQIDRGNDPAAQREVSQLEIAQFSKRRTENVFVTEEIFEERANNHVCSICLEGETNLSIKCGHYFHAECLFQWLKKRMSCPECRTEDLGSFALYCGTCLKNYQKVNQLKPGDRYMCKYCKL